MDRELFEARAMREEAAKLHEEHRALRQLLGQMMADRFMLLEEQRKLREELSECYKSCLRAIDGQAKPER